MGFGVLSHSRAVGFAFRLLFIDAGGRREALARCSETRDVVTTGAGDRAPRSATSLPPGAQAPRCRRRGPVVAVHTPRAAFQQRSAGLGGNHRFYRERNEKPSLRPGENVTSSVHRGCTRRTPPWETARAKGAQGLGCSARRPAHPGALGGWGLGLSPQPRTHYVTSQGLVFLKLGKRWHPPHKGVVRAGRAHPFSALGPERVVSPG